MTVVFKNIEIFTPSPPAPHTSPSTTPSISTDTFSSSEASPSPSPSPYKPSSAYPSGTAFDMQEEREDKYSEKGRQGGQIQAEGDGDGDGEQGFDYHSSKKASGVAPSAAVAEKTKAYPIPYTLAEKTKATGAKAALHDNLISVNANVVFNHRSTTYYSSNISNGQKGCKDLEGEGERALSEEGGGGGGGGAVIGHDMQIREEIRGEYASGGQGRRLSMTQYPSMDMCKRSTAATAAFYE